MSLQKIMKATAILGIGMISETSNCVKELKPQKFMGCYMHKPVPKAYVIFDKKDPLDLSKARFMLLLDNKEILSLKKCLKMKTIRYSKLVKWYKFEQFDEYVVRFNSDKFRKRINDICSEYRNCTEIHDEVNHALEVASARYYDLMKKNKAFPGQNNVI